MAEISSNRTIAKNTVLLYGRMVFTMLVSLYTTRVILSTLGVIDDGIYNVVGGVVGMFTFLKGTLSGATSRFITFELGKGDIVFYLHRWNRNKCYCFHHAYMEHAKRETEIK